MSDYLDDIDIPEEETEDGYPLDDLLDTDMDDLWGGDSSISSQPLFDEYGDGGFDDAIVIGDD